jgi:two-component system KDP operon response regulator KdpE
VSPERILVVDDAPMVRTVTRRMLESGGYEVIEAADAAEALRLFEQERPRVVLSDVVMPGMRGTDLARALRAIEPGVAVILVSGDTGTEPTGASDLFLEKPFSIDTLLEAVRAALAQPPR